MKVHKGTIIGVLAYPGSGIAYLKMNDTRKGEVFVIIQNPAAIKGLNQAFDGFITGPFTFDNDAIKGKEIYFSVDRLGILEAFTPVDEADPSIVAAYEKSGHDHRAFTGTKMSH